MTVIFETSRLVIRSLTSNDLHDLYMLQSDPAVMRYIGHGVRSLEEVQSTLHLCLEHEKQCGFGLCAVIEKDSQKFIGRAGLIHWALNPHLTDIEIAFAFHRAYWQKGYGYEAVSKLLQEWFKDPSHQKVLAVARMENTSSIKLLEKLGMHFDGKREYQDISNVGLYSVSRVNFIKKPRRQTDV